MVSMADDKKRVSLPVVRDAPDDDEERPASSWVLLGAAAIVLFLVPMMGAAATIAEKFQAKTMATVVAAIACLALASIAGGWLAGRFGRGVLPRHGAAAGAIAGVVLWAMSRTAFGFALLAVTVPVAALGARLGRRARGR
jgi:hypothetical protein